MPLNLDLKLPDTIPPQQLLTLSGWRKGVITLIDKSRVPRDALIEAQNIFLAEDGTPTVRPGVNWYGTAPGTGSSTLLSTRTNLMTNPSFETNTTNWLGFNDGSISRSSARAYNGFYSLAVVVGDDLDGGQTDNVAISGSTTYRVTAKLYVPLGMTVTFEVDEYDSDGNYITNTPHINYHGDDSWQDVEVNFTSDSDSESIQIYFYIPVGGTAGTFNIDTVLVEEADSTQSDYFDGSFTDTDTEVYAWTGTAHASTSTVSYYTITTPTIDGAGTFETSGGDNHLVVVAGGTIYRSTNNGSSWSSCSGATLTSGKKVFMVQDHSYLYITNKEDNIVRYDGTTTLQTYTALTTPGAPTPTETGLSGTGYNHYYKISAVNNVGFTAASSASSAVQSSIDRGSWDSTTNFVSLSWSAVTGATRYDIYISNDNIDYFYLDSVIGNTSTVYQDIGTGGAIPNTNILAPTDNTTQGPLVQRLEQIGSRLWGVEDKDNPWRVWFSGSGAYAGYFSAAYDGGYIDIMKGSQFRPVRVVDYRDGKGTPYATVWCSSADGQGCIWQISLEVLTVGDVSITVPSAFRLPGSRGTEAPDSVVNVLNDYYFYNSQGFYSLGSRAQFLNLLSTDEISVNIRPSIKQVSSVAAPDIASIYYDAKVYFSVPYGSNTNNYTIVYDTERKAWLPEAFTLGFDRFFQFSEVSSDGTITRRLLAWKNGDTKLSEINNNIQGDYGAPFDTALTTGLYPIGKDRFDFMFIDEGEIEFSQPKGRLFIELIGIERSQGFSSTATETLVSSVSNTGWTTFDWSSTAWSDTTEVPETYSESSVKRYFRVSRELNAYQWRVTSNSIDADYLLRTLQLKGTLTGAGKPRTWRLD